jgi:hypothetical protein
MAWIRGALVIFDLVAQDLILLESALKVSVFPSNSLPLGRQQSQIMQLTVKIATLKLKIM